MNRTKIFLALTFILIFIFQIFAKNEMPKIVWKNLQEKYENFEDVKPVVENISDKPIFIYPDFDSDDVLAFDNDTNEWIAGKYIFACGNSPNFRFSKYIKLKPNQSLILSSSLDWEYLLLGPFSSGLLKNNNDSNKVNVNYYKQNRKYKLAVFYSEKKRKDLQRAYSSEFWINPTN